MHELLDREKFDILGLCETWFREDSREDCFEHQGYKVTRNERAGDAIQGGGLLLLVKESMKAVGYIPRTDIKFKECETERVWTLVVGDGVRLAIGFGYFASTSRAGYSNFNEKMYAMIEEDMRILKDDGYGIVILGDMNGHVGPRSNLNPHGVIGDSCARNSNGTLLVNFVERNDFIIANNMPVCSGVFTRVEGGRCSVVDYGLIDESLAHLVHSLVIDEDRSVCTGSDHGLLTLRLKTQNVWMAGEVRSEIIRFNITERTSFESYTQGLEDRLEEFEREMGEMSLT